MKNRYSVIVLLAAAYLFLTISPMACGLVDVDGHRTSTHHHSGHSHSTFCAWACQAHPATGLVAPEWPFKPLGAVPLLSHIPASVASIHLSHSPESRGPPASTTHSL